MTRKSPSRRQRDQREKEFKRKTGQSASVSKPLSDKTFGARLPPNEDLFPYLYKRNERESSTPSTFQIQSVETAKKTQTPDLSQPSTAPKETPASVPFSFDRAPENNISLAQIKAHLKTRPCDDPIWEQMDGFAKDILKIGDQKKQENRRRKRIDQLRPIYEAIFRDHANALGFLEIKLPSLDDLQETVTPEQLYPFKESMEAFSEYQKNTPKPETLKEYNVHYRRLNELSEECLDCFERFNVSVSSITSSEPREPQGEKEGTSYEESPPVSAVPVADAMEDSSHPVQQSKEECKKCETHCEEIKKLKKGKYKLEQKVENLQKKNDSAPESRRKIIQEFFEKDIGKHQGEQLKIRTLKEALSLLDSCYPDKVQILPTAFESAEEAADFKDPQKAFFLMLRLVTQYRQVLVEGGSDSMAKKKFTDTEFAGNECDSVDKEKRTFEGHHMPKHLKIGNGEGTSNGWRCHFDYEHTSQKIRIGHCGKHLDFK